MKNLGFGYNHYTGALRPLFSPRGGMRVSQSPPVVEHWRDSNDYRRQYFEKNRGFMGMLYICSQCMRPMFRNSQRLQVDHIIAPSRFSNKKMVGGRFSGKQQGIKDTSIGARFLNNSFNCVAICDTCNRNKSNKLGLYAVRGIAAKLMEVTVKVASFAVVLGVSASLLVAGTGFRLMGNLLRSSIGRRGYGRRRTSRRPFRKLKTEGAILWVIHL